MSIFLLDGAVNCDKRIYKNVRDIWKKQTTDELTYNRNNNKKLSLSEKILSEKFIVLSLRKV